MRCRALLVVVILAMGTLALGGATAGPAVGSRSSTTRATAAPLARVEVGKRRLEAAGADALLLADARHRVLQVVGTGSGEVQQRLPLPDGRYLTGVAVLVDGSTIWADTSAEISGAGGALVHLDLTSGTTLSVTPPNDSEDVHVAPVAITGGDAWAVLGTLYDQPATLVRVAGTDGTISASVDLPFGWGTTTLGPDGALWVFASDGVARIDPTTLAVERPGRILRLDFVESAVSTEDAIWLVTADQIVRYDTTARRAVQRVALGDSLEEIVLADGRLWVTNSRRLQDAARSDVGRDHNRVFEVDAATGRRLRTHRLADLPFNGGTGYTDYPRPRVRTDGTVVWVAHDGAATQLWPR